MTGFVIFVYIIVGLFIGALLGIIAKGEGANKYIASVTGFLFRPIVVVGGIITLIVYLIYKFLED